MRDRIDRDSPIPLYHQIAEAIRHAIAVGGLTSGDRLPSVRAAAREWGVHLHTVRKAYAELADDGLVRVRGAYGTEVAAGGRTRGPRKDLDAFLSSWVGSAREQFGLTQVQLGQLLLKRAAGGATSVVHMMECSHEQAAGHARELTSTWRVDAAPLNLSEVSELPRGTLIGTYFHYNDIRQRWPHRLEDVRFVAIVPDESIRQRVPHVRGRAPQRLLVCELDAAKAVNIAADVKHLFRERRCRVEPKVLREPLRLPRLGEADVLLVSPRVWAGLKQDQRNRVVPIHYRIRGFELESLGLEFGWQRTATEATS